MSSQKPNSQSQRLTAPAIRRRKGGDPIVFLTAYDALTASLIDTAVDGIIVGDSLGMVRYGFDSTLPVTLEMMRLPALAVVRASQRACVVVDLPFGSYEAGPAQAFKAAAYLMKETGCQAVKLEGGTIMVETVAFLTQRGIPVMGHIGLTPQHVQQMGGFKVQGKTEAAVEQLIKDARALEEAGAFSIVLEGMKPDAALRVTQEIGIPSIGIGASTDCDGQVLVTEDMLGLTPWAPKFVRRYGNLGEQIKRAAENYAEDVRGRKFPSEDETY